MALAWAARGGGGRRRGGGRRGGAEREGISASSISLFDVRPAPNSAVRATLSKWLGGHQRKCLGTTPPPVLLRLLTKPYRYSVLYRRSRLTFFPEREKEREWRGRVFRLSRRFLEKKENAPREGKKGRGKLCRPREKRIQKLGRIIFRSALSTVYTTNTSPSLFFLQRENRELFFFKFPLFPAPTMLKLPFPFSLLNEAVTSFARRFFRKNRDESSTIRFIRETKLRSLTVPRACFFLP